MNRFFPFFIATFFSVSLFSAERYEFEETHMGVPVRIVLYAENADIAKNAAKEGFASFQKINGIMSDYDSESELSVLCANSGSNRVSDDLFTVLRAAKHYCTISDGAFDVTVGPMVRLWRRSRRQKELPKPQYIEQAKTLVGNDLWEQNEACRSVKLLKTGMRIDLGGIAKGYAIDKAFEIIQKRGITKLMVDAGGDLRVGSSPDDDAWKIETSDKKIVPLKNAAMATSGERFQFVEIDGVRYAHIVDPNTGLGVTEQRTVHVVAPTAMEADALASAVYVLGKEKGEKLIGTLPNVSVKIIH